MPGQFQRAPFHVLRASALGTGILTLAAGAHLAGGSQLPAPAILLALLALTALACTAATRLRLAFPAMAALMGAAQLALHELLTALGGSMPPVEAGTLPQSRFPAVAFPPGFPGGTLHQSHQHGGSPPVLPELLPLARHFTPTDPGSAPLMLAAHTVATLGCALLLAKGEAALWTLAAWLRPLAGLPCPVVPGSIAPAVLPALPAPLSRRPWRNLRQDSRRGPPSAVAPSF